MSDQWTDRLSEYLDNELEARERLALEIHLKSCPGCQEVLDDLRAVVDRAQTLTSRAPAVDLWPAIRARLEEQPANARTWRSWRLTFSIPQLAAASLALVLLGGGVTWLTRLGVPFSRPADRPAVATATPGAGEPVNATLANFADPQYDAAVADLQKALQNGRGRLDPKTIEIVERNLATIDQAIDQAWQALRADPGNPYLNSYLADARRRKLALLREATQLPDFTS